VRRFSTAAAVRHISQPALSQHVRLLERGLKRKLFERDGRTMRFTHEGERVLAEARRIIEVHDASLRRLEAEQDRTIVVGSTEHSAEQILPEMIRALQAAFPEYSTRFEIGGPPSSPRPSARARSRSRVLATGRTRSACRAVGARARRRRESPRPGAGAGR
jgi:DNA-binding transcriptional LysR family regulator